MSNRKRTFELTVDVTARLHLTVQARTPDEAETQVEDAWRQQLDTASDIEIDIIDICDTTPGGAA